MFCFSFPRENVWKIYTVWGSPAYFLILFDSNGRKWWKISLRIILLDTNPKQRHCLLCTWCHSVRRQCALLCLCSSWKPGCHSCSCYQNIRTPSLQRPPNIVLCMALFAMHGARSVRARSRTEILEVWDSQNLGGSDCRAGFEHSVSRPRTSRPRAGIKNSKWLPQNTKHAAYDQVITYWVFSFSGVLTTAVTRCPFSSACFTTPFPVRPVTSNTTRLSNLPSPEAAMLEDME